MTYRSRVGDGRRRMVRVRMRVCGVEKERLKWASN